MIKIFYTPKMAVTTRTSSPSPSKPPRVVGSWLRNFSGIEVVEPEAVTVDQLCMAHDRTYVNGVMEGRIRNGFGNYESNVATSLLYTSGSMLAAAREAIANGKVAVAPCSGFHHSGYARSEGYCTFNGLMVTAMALKSERCIECIGILDFDHHYGNGTQNIINQLNLNWVNHYTSGINYRYTRQAEEFLQSVPNLARSMIDCDLVLYQAGADPHINDPLGGWLTTEQLRRRDQLVFETLASLSVPVAWNLAGGYQTPFSNVLKIHDNTLSECLAVYGAGS
jgi:acetoin utilization deacetylase AcuC-like enzyme